MKILALRFLLALGMTAAPLQALEARQEVPPHGVVLLNSGEKYTRERSVLVRVRVTQAGTGDLEISISNDPKTPGEWKKLLDTQTFELTSGDGEKTVTVRLRDSAGKESKPLSASILLDTTPPQAKATAPERVSGNTVILSSDVPDAVAMQWTKDPRSWGPWSPYVQPCEIPLAPGEGPKTILVRYRDEAGNVGAPASVRVEVSARTPAEPPTPGLRAVRLAGSFSIGERLTLTVTVDASGLEEMELALDGDKPRPREKFNPQVSIELAKTGAAHRIRLKFRDAKGLEQTAELAFQESDLRSSPAEEAPVPLPRPPGFVAVKLGVLPSAVHFESLTTKGTRKLEPGAMTLARAECGLEFYDPLFAQLSFEYGYGKEVQFLSGDLDLGVHLLSTELFSCQFELDAEAGLMVSQLRATVSDFGSFDTGVGFRAGIEAHLYLSERLTLDALVDYRNLSYAWSGVVVSGDRDARTSTVGLFVGLSWRF